MGNYFFLKIIYFKPFNEIIQFFTSSKIQFNSFVIVTYIRMIALDAQIWSLGNGGVWTTSISHVYVIEIIYIYMCFLNGTQILQSPLFIKKQKLGFL